MARHKARGQCIYCGGSKQLTRDHVPPKSFFPRGTPAPLITVPSCQSCNAGFQRDDEYVRAVFLMRKDVDASSTADPLIGSFLRSLDRPDAAPFRVALTRSLVDADIHTPGGVYLGRAPVHTVDKTRLGAFVVRVTKGLHFKEHQRRIPDNFRVTPVLTVEHDNGLRMRILAWIHGGTKRHIQPGVFSYAWLSAPDESGASIWAMEYYNSVLTAAVVVDPNTPAATGHVGG